MALLPNTIRFDGYVYRKVRAAFDDDVQTISTGLQEAVVKFDGFMQLHQEGNTAQALPMLIGVFDGAYGASQACQRIFHEVVPMKREASPQKVRYQGRSYTAVSHPYESLQASDAAREYEIGVSHLASVMEDASTVLSVAKSLLQSLSSLRGQAEGALTRTPDPLVPGEVDALNPDVRADEFTAPLRLINKANKALNYSVDAASTAIKIILDQVDTMTDDWVAKSDALNAPTSPKELTKPMLHADNPAAFDIDGI